jgi:hypothetical protein
MPDRDEDLLKLLKDAHALVLAYSASSEYVMRLSFDRIRGLQAFRGRAELAPDVLEQYEGLVERVHDSVVLGAHLYALELTGARHAVREAVVATLDRKDLRHDPMLGQAAGKAGARLLRRRLPRGKDLSDQELDEVWGTLKKEVAR